MIEEQTPRCSVSRARQGEGPESHPEEGHLPPCESGIDSDKPCPRPAVWHYGRFYLCDEHAAWMQAGEDHNEAEMAVYHAKRFLWKAQVEGIDRLEHHIAQALRELLRRRG